MISTSCLQGGEFDQSGLSLFRELSYFHLHEQNHRIAKAAVRQHPASPGRVCLFHAWAACGALGVFDHHYYVHSLIINSMFGRIAFA